jgi:hypothetical protein
MATDERAVLGDELQQRGEPQGELIALQLALEALPADAAKVRRDAIAGRIARHLDHHHDALYGVLAPHVNRLSRPDLRYPALEVRAWRGGFADTVWLQAVPGLTLAELVRALRELPIAQELRCVELGYGEVAGAVAELARAPLRSLRELRAVHSRFSPSSLGGERLTLSAFAPIAEGLVRLHLGEVDAGELASSTLRSLAAWLPWPGNPVLALAAPALEQLSVSNIAIDRALFDRYPKLRILDHGGSVDAGVLAHLVASPHLARFERIVLGAGLDDHDLDAVVRYADRVATLACLDLRHSTFSPAALAAARPRLPASVKLPHG